MNDKKKTGRWLRPMIAAALAVSVMMTLPALAAGEPVDLEKECSVTVAAGTETQSADVGDKVIIDLYKIADAEEVPGYSTYRFAAIGDYKADTVISQGLEDVQKITVETDKAKAQADAADIYAKVAQAAASIALQTTDPDAAGMAGTPIEGLSSGLYLVIARGEDVSDYLQQAEDGTITTIANSEDWVYTYTPELVALPGTETFTTDNAQWIYDANTVLKPAQDVRYGDLEITKTLNRYETRDPATFVFTIDAYKNNELVYSNAVSLVFTEAGTQSVKIEGKIPNGAQVTVKEVYSGAVYNVVGSAEAVTVIDAQNGTQPVSFSNDYNSTDKRGGSIDNRFEFAEEHWSWSSDLKEQ